MWLREQRKKILPSKARWAEVTVRLADMAARVERSRPLVWRAAERLVAGLPCENHMCDVGLWENRRQHLQYSATFYL